GGDISSDAGGALLLRQVERRLGLLAAAAKCLPDDRDPNRVRHSRLSQVKQRVMGIALGYEDLNDHDTLRADWGLQLALGQSRAASSAPTLCRFEKVMGRKEAVALHGVLIDNFIASHAVPPSELTLDLDATDDAVHGRQEGRFFHGYYDQYCFLPLYVFCGDELLTAYLRPANIDGAKHAAAIVKLLVQRLRRAWPEVKITIRADSGFCRRRLLSWCERNGVFYVIGLARNARLAKLAAASIINTEAAFQNSGEKQRGFDEVRYAAKSWHTERRVIVRLEHGPQGANPRYVVTNRDEEPAELYDGIYCQRGEMENRIKEQQLGLFADRTSCSAWWPNQFRLLLA
ncbi:IS1380 family transposase, partial [Pseudomarimonas arenosa]